MNLSKYRDLTILDDGHKKLVIACDSSGAIGSKPLDVVKVDPYTVGRFLSRVVLMELISIGARVVTIIDTLAVEMEPTGKEIIRGIRDEAFQIGLDTNEIINGSTEENVVVQQTGVGLTAIGYCNEIYSSSNADDYIICIGIPKVGKEVYLADQEICNLQVIKQVRKIAGVHEIVPVGSKGINYEIGELLKRNQLCIEWLETPINLDKSGGPTTCAILSLTPKALETIKISVFQPVFLLGKLTKKIF